MWRNRMSSTDFGSTTEPVPPADRRAVSLISNPLFDLVRLAVAPKTAAGSPTAAWIRQRPVLALIGLAYGPTWIGLIPLIRNPGIASQANWSHAGNPAVLVYASLGVL